jgi:hypothetical protein
MFVVQICVEYKRILQLETRARARRRGGLVCVADIWEVQTYFALMYEQCFFCSRVHATRDFERVSFHTCAIASA